MFLPHSEPLLLSEAGLHGLCASLNSPVLNIDELPVGPARAAIVLYAGDYGALQLAVGVRSLKSGEVAIFAYSQDLNEFTSPAAAMDAALGFAEGMGFLFDEDMVEGRGRAEALATWAELTSEAPLPGPELSGDSPAESGPLSDDDLLEEPRPEEGSGELLLEDLALAADGDASQLGESPLLEHELEPAPEDLSVDFDETDSPGIRPGPAPPEPAVRAGILTKFRGSEGPCPAEGGRQPAPESQSAADPRSSEDSAGGNELGRIPLVRRRVGSESNAKPGLLLRLLGSF